MKKLSIIIQLIGFIFLSSCESTSTKTKQNQVKSNSTLNLEQKKSGLNEFQQNNELNLLFAGDVMAHNVNYYITDLNKIWRDVKSDIQKADLAFANIESPVDTTKEVSSYPNFNMNKEFLKACIDAGFDVFSLCNNHTNDQGLTGILETDKTVKNLTEEYKDKNQMLYFSGLKDSKDEYSYNLIYKNSWKILFLPITEILNRPDYFDYMNYVAPTEKQRENFKNYCKKLYDTIKPDLFIISVHANEEEYVRKVEQSQKNYYLDLLETGADIIWANHAHIIKDRLFVIDSKTDKQKLIMFANGNTISGQRTRPEFEAEDLDLERDNTGDGLFYSVSFSKTKNGKIKIKQAEAIYITTYINTAWEFVIKRLDKDFIQYLKDVQRFNWANYAKKRIELNEEKTKDLVTWQ